MFSGGLLYREGRGRLLLRFELDGYVRVFMLALDQYKVSQLSSRSRLDQFHHYTMECAREPLTDSTERSPNPVLLFLDCVYCNYSNLLVRLPGVPGASQLSMFGQYDWPYS